MVRTKPRIINNDKVRFLARIEFSQDRTAEGSVPLRHAVSLGNRFPTFRKICSTFIYSGLKVITSWRCPWISAISEACRKNVWDRRQRQLSIPQQWCIYNKLRDVTSQNEVFNISIIFRYSLLKIFSIWLTFIELQMKIIAFFLSIHRADCILFLFQPTMHIYIYYFKNIIL